MKVSHAALAMLLAGLLPLAARAATISNLEDVTVNGQGTYTAATFTSQGITYDGVATEFSDGFTVSNHTDTTDYGDDAFLHQYDAIPGTGATGSAQYAVASDFFSTYALLTADPVSIDITNNTYAYYSMAHGDGFSKKFGGPSGNDPDYFRLTIKGLTSGDVLVGTVEFYLADFRGTGPGYIVDAWEHVSLRSLAGARKLTFALDSTDNGDFGMNTPAYFAIDNLAMLGPYTLGDMDGGGSLDNFDIQPFELALTDTDAYLATYPTLVDFEFRGDADGNGHFDNFDIAPFETLLTSGAASGTATAVPEPSALSLLAIGSAACGTLTWLRRRKHDCAT